MNDAEKIEKIKEIVGKWALDDSSTNLDILDVLIQIMETLEFNPYPAVHVFDHKEVR